MDQIGPYLCANKVLTFRFELINSVPDDMTIHSRSSRRPPSRGEPGRYSHNSHGQLLSWRPHSRPGERISPYPCSCLCLTMANPAVKPATTQPAWGVGLVCILASVCVSPWPTRQSNRPLNSRPWHQLFLQHTPTVN